MNSSENSEANPSVPQIDHNPGQETYKALEAAEAETDVQSASPVDPTIPVPPAPGSRVEAILRGIEKGIAEDADRGHSSSSVRLPPEIDL
jgi:hypothetical protein